MIGRTPGASHVHYTHALTHQEEVLQGPKKDTLLERLE